MLYSISYQSANIVDADEIKCPCNQLGLLFKFIKQHPEKRINITVPSDYNDIDKLLEQADLVISVIGDNYTITCGDLILLDILLNKGYKACVKFPVADWETFGILKEHGVSDIYIDGPLGFQVDNLIQAKGNVNIRVTPALSPNAAFSRTSNASSFFIRPEDIDRYSEVIDILDFPAADIDREDALFKAYRRKSFPYNLALLIANLNTQTENALIRDDFADHRLNCGQKCKVPGHPCHICDSQIYITNQLLRYYEKDQAN